MKAVLDTNVLISGVISTGVSHTVLVRGFENDYELLISEPIIQEFRDTLLKYPDKFQMTRDEVATEVETIEYFGTFVVPDETITAIEADPSDNMMLEAGVAGNADYIVSGDSHLLDIGSHRGIDIVDPSTFLTGFD